MGALIFLKHEEKPVAVKESYDKVHGRLINDSSGWVDLTADVWSNRDLQSGESTQYQPITIKASRITKIVGSDS